MNTVAQWTLMNLENRDLGQLMLVLLLCYRPLCTIMQEYAVQRLQLSMTAG